MTPRSGVGGEPPAAARSTAARRWLLVGGFLLLAALLRIARVEYHAIPYDDATVALIARHVLHGEDFPVFFYRQTYMGSLNGFHLVPALFLFGPSAWLVGLNAVAYSLLFPLLLYLLGRRLCDEATARVALLLAAVPPFLVTKWSSLAEPHFETNSFGLLLLLLAVAALRAEPGGARQARLLGCFGLTAGLAWWTNFKALEILLPALLVLWLRDRRLPLRRAGALLAAGFLLGSLPVWLFYATHGHDAGARAAQLFEPGSAASLDRAVRLVTTVLPTLLGTYYWPPDTLPRRAALLLNLSLYAAGAVALVAEAARRRRAGEEPADRRHGLWLLLLVLVTPFAMVYASGFAGRIVPETSRYVLPAYVPLFLGVATLVVRLWRRSRAAGAATLAFLVGFNLWTTAGFLWPLDPGERGRRAAYVAAHAAIRRHLAARPVEALYVDDALASLEWAAELEDLPVSEPTSEMYLPHAVAADAAGRVAVLARRDRGRLPALLDQLGAAYRVTAFPGRHLLLDEIRLPARRYRLVPREVWRVPGDGAPPAVADADLATAWTAPAASGRSQPALIVDLGAPHQVGRVLWWPSTAWEETPAVTVAISPDGTRWERVTAADGRRPAFVAAGRPFFRPRNGWLEARVAARPVRYLRFASADPDPPAGWGIAEVAVYEDTGPLAEAAPGPDGRALAALLGARGVGRLLADPAAAARVARASGGAIRTPPANGFLDSHGRHLPPARLAEPVRLRATDALLVPEDDAEDLRGRLREAGVEFREEAVGGYRLLHGLAPVVPAVGCRRASWRIAPAPEPTGAPGRLTLEVALRDARPVVGVRLEQSAPVGRDAPLPVLAVSQDGQSWRPVGDVRRVESWGWAGRTLFRFSQAAQELVLPVTAARHLRVELTLPASGEPAIRSVCVRMLPRAGRSLALRRWPGAGLMDGGDRVK